MKRKVTWIRHGQSDWNAAGLWQGHTDTVLSEHGRAQAKALHPRLRSYRFDAIYSSDLSRSLETSKLALPQAEVRVDERLREINFGIFEGKCSADLTEMERQSVGSWWVEPYAIKLEGGESMSCLNTRVDLFLTELPLECDVAIFTHGGVIRNAIWQVVSVPQQGAWSVLVDNTSLTTLEYTSERITIHCINDRAHLEELAADGAGDGLRS